MHMMCIVCNQSGFKEYISLATPSGMMCIVAGELCVQV